MPRKSNGSLLLHDRCACRSSLTPHEHLSEMNEWPEIQSSQWSKKRQFNVDDSAAILSAADVKNYSIAEVWSMQCKCRLEESEISRQSPTPKFLTR
uniref:Uncharacterized protein n=1 Tax=Ditylenchus dipsaci TaxID=166011 RepID=A0A915ESI2_9BILA